MCSTTCTIAPEASRSDASAGLHTTVLAAAGRGSRHDARARVLHRPRPAHVTSSGFIPQRRTVTSDGPKHTPFFSSSFHAAAAAAGAGVDRLAVYRYHQRRALAARLLPALLREPHALRLMIIISKRCLLAPPNVLPCLVNARQPRKQGGPTSAHRKCPRPQPCGGADASNGAGNVGARAAGQRAPGGRPRSCERQAPDAGRRPWAPKPTRRQGAAQSRTRKPKVECVRATTAELHGAAAAARLFSRGADPDRECLVASRTPRRRVSSVQRWTTSQCFCVAHGIDGRRGRVAGAGGGAGGTLLDPGTRLQARRLQQHELLHTRRLCLQTPGATSERAAQTVSCAHATQADQPPVRRGRGGGRRRRSHRGGAAGRAPA